MLKQLKLRKELELKKQERESLISQEETFKKRSEELEEKLENATTEGDLLMAEDSSAIVKEYFAYNKDIWTPFNDERKTYGVFDECGTFYIRLEIDSMSNTQRSEDVCGNIFLFAEETILSSVGNHFKDGCGQLVIEGAADYFALLED